MIAVLPGIALGALSFVAIRWPVHDWAGTPAALTPTLRIVAIGAAIGWGAMGLGELLLRASA
jgi:hypothetical protein